MPAVAFLPIIYKRIFMMKTYEFGGHKDLNSIDSGEAEPRSA